MKVDMMAYQMVVYLVVLMVAQKVDMKAALRAG